MSPVGSYEALYAAIEAGADSVYFGVEGLNMRSRSANNFTIEDLKNIADIASQNGVKTYLTLNTIVYDSELGYMQEILNAAKQSGVSVISTIHGENIEDAKEKLGQAMDKLFKKKVIILKKGEYICY